MCVGNHEKHEKHERDGILAIKFDDKISEYFVNYTYIQSQNLVITIFFDLELGLRLCQFIL